MRGLLDNMWFFVLVILIVSMSISTAIYFFYMSGRV